MWKGYEKKMIDFACKQFNLDDIIKCGLGLTKTEFKVMNYFLSHKNECRTSTISEKMSLNLTTVQKAVKKLFEKGIIWSINLHKRVPSTIQSSCTSILTNT